MKKIIYTCFCVIFTWINAYNMQEAYADLCYMRTTILENHPGVYNAEDPQFLERIEQAFVASSCHLEQINTAEEYMAAVVDFAKSFQDPHVDARFYQQFSSIKNIKQHGDFFMAKLSNDITWISLPTFTPNDGEQKILCEIIEKLPTMRSEKLLIFDVRGNGGGNSCWADKIVQALFGTKYVEMMAAKANKEVYIEWRASMNNIEHLTKLLPTFEKDFGQDAKITLWLKEIIHGLQYSYERGDLFYTEKPIQDDEYIQCDDLNPVTAQIMLVIDSGCGSACLDFIDLFKTMEHKITLFGQTTNADTVYMEICTIEFPSKMGTFCFPIKVYRNRPRGNKVPYYPDYVFKGDIKNDSLLMSAIWKDFCLIYKCKKVFIWNLDIPLFM